MKNFDKLLAILVIGALITAYFALSERSNVALSTKDLLNPRKTIYIAAEKGDKLLQKEAGDGNIHPFILDKWESMR